MACLALSHEGLCRVSGSWGTQPEYNSDRRECPLYYERLKYEDIRDRRAVPYLLGGRQRPHCRQCHSNAPWARFCSWDFSRFSKCGGPSSQTDTPVCCLVLRSCGALIGIVR